MFPTVIALPARLTAVKIGVTVPEAWLATSTTFPFGVIARAKGSFPTLLGLPALLALAMPRQQAATRSLTATYHTGSVHLPGAARDPAMARWRRTDGVAARL